MIEQPRCTRHGCAERLVEVPLAHGGLGWVCRSCEKNTNGQCREPGCRAPLPDHRAMRCRPHARAHHRTQQKDFDRRQRRDMNRKAVLCTRQHCREKLERGWCRACAINDRGLCREPGCMAALAESHALRCPSHSRSHTDAMRRAAKQKRRRRRRGLPPSVCSRKNCRELLVNGVCLLCAINAKGICREAGCSGLLPNVKAMRCEPHRKERLRKQNNASQNRRYREDPTIRQRCLNNAKARRTNPATREALLAYGRDWTKKNKWSEHDRLLRIARKNKSGEAQQGAAAVA